jgi:hypothetical protein
MRTEVRLVQPRELLCPDLDSRHLSVISHTHMAKSLSL